MPQFCLLFYAIVQSWRPKRGGMAQCPVKYAPATTQTAEQDPNQNTVWFELLS